MWFDSHSVTKGLLIMKYILYILLFFATTTQAQVTHVTLTYYQPVKEQCNNQPLITADGSKINLHHLKTNRIKWCAISRDLLYLFPKNKPKRVYIEGYGVYEVRDLMNKRFHHRIDILIHPKDSKRVCIEGVKVKIL